MKKPVRQAVLAACPRENICKLDRITGTGSKDCPSYGFFHRLITTRLLIAGLLAALPLPAQLVLRSGADPVSNTLTLPGTYATDIYETKLTLVNTASQSASVTSLSIAGASFSLPDAPPIPRQLAAGESLPFTLRFAPTDAGSFSGVLQAGTLTVFVLGKSLAGPTLYVDGDAVHPPASINFGIAETGTEVKRHFSLRNLLRQPIVISALAATGDFTLASSPALPFMLAPGATADFEVIAKSPHAGALTGNLVFEGRQVALAGLAFDHPLPLPVILFRDAEVKSAQQSRLSISLSEPARISGTGSVEFAFELLTNGLAGDPGVVFPASGTRSIAFTVEPGDTLVRFGSVTYADFQTGTIAGDLVFRVRFGEFLDTATRTVAPGAIGVDQVRVTRVAGEVDVEVTGFDNTRSASKLTFTFFNRDGTAIAPGAIPFDATDSFHSWFATSGLGGMFSLKATFPVTGAADRITGVELDLVNSQGTTHTQRVTF